MSIRSKLLVGFLAASMVSSLAGGILLYSLAKRGIEQGTSEQLQNATATIVKLTRTTLSSLVRERLLDKLHDCQRLADQFRILHAEGDFSAEEARGAALRILGEETVDAHGLVTVVSEGGELLAGPRTSPVARGLAQGEDVLGAMEGAHGFLVHHLPAAGGGEPEEWATCFARYRPWDWVIVVSLKREDFPKVEVRLDRLKEVILTLRMGSTGYPYIMDSRGNLIVHPKLEGSNVFESTDESGRKIIQEICEKKNGQLIYSWQNPGEQTRREKLAIFHYIPEFDWIVASSSYLDDFLGPLDTIKYIVIASLAGTVLLVLLLAIGLGASLTGSLRALTRNMAQGAKGDFSARCQVSSRDEIGALAEYFNEFMAQLEGYSAQLKSSEEKYRGIYENAVMGLFQTAADGRLLSLNQALARIWGYDSPQEAMAEIKDVGRQAYFDPKDRAAFQEIMKGQGYITGFEARMRRRDGALIWVSISSRVVRDEQGNALCYEGSLVDITDHKLAEAEFHRSMDRYRLLLESTPDSVTVYDNQGRVVYVNKAFEETFGWSLEEIQGQRLDFVPESEREKTKEAVLRTLEGERGLIESQRLTKDGRVIEVQINSAGYPDAEGNIEGILVITRDITTRKRAEEGLRASEERYRTILDNIEDGYYELDLSGHFTFFNESLRKAIGYSEAELKGLDFRDYVVPEYLEAAAGTFAEVFKTGKAATVFDWEVIKKDGSRGFIEASVSLIRDAKGIPTGFRGIARDITERRRAERELQKEKNRFKVLVEESPLGVSLILPDGRFEYVNPQFVRIFGWSLEDVPWSRDWMRKIFPDPQMRHKVVQEWLAELKAINVGQHSSRTYEVVCGDQSRKSVLFSPVALPGGGHLVIYEDITESKRAEEALRASEERYRTILASIEDGYYEVDLHGRFTYFNNSMCRILGYRPEDLMGMDYRSYVSAIYVERVFQTFNQVFRTKEGTKALDWLLIRSDGGTVFVEISVSPVFDAERNVAGFRGIARDVSERRMAEEALKRAHDELETRVAERTAELAEANRHLQELDKMKSDFLSSVSHELRTPLTSILGFAKLMKREFHKHFAPIAGGDAKLTPKAARIEENLEIIIREGERLTRLINDVLDLTKIESGRLEWRDETCPVAELVQQAVQAVSGEFANRPQVALRMRVQEDLPPLTVDRDRLVQVMINLLNNASKFTSEGEVAIKAAAGQGLIRIEVSDTGPGIPADNLAQVFDQFYQVVHEDTLVDKPKGTGLGLSICKQIVEHYGGRIWAESQLGRGTTIIIEIPQGEAGDTTGFAG